MFLGEYSHSLDPKGRVTIPARFRDGLQSGMVVTPGYERCLTIYPLSEWSILASKASELPTASAMARSYRRRLFGRAFEVSLDKLGRILIPGVLREYATIESDAILVGLNTYIEVWAPELWKETMGLEDNNLDAIEQEAYRLGV